MLQIVPTAYANRKPAAKLRAHNAAGTVFGVLTRRTLLLAAATAATVGCTPNPSIVGGPTSPPEVPDLPLLPGADVARQFEADLFGLARTWSEDPAAPALAGALAQAHQARMLALRQPEPVNRATTEPSPQPGFTPPAEPPPSVDNGAGSAGLADRLPAAQEQYRQFAVEAAGAVALFWASLAAACAGESAALAGGRTGAELVDAEVHPLAEHSDVDLLTAAVSACHAVIYSYPIALGALSGRDAQTAHDALGQRRDLRDQLEQLLLDRGETPPAAATAYDVAGVGTDAAAATDLLAQTEARFARIVGPLAASPDAVIRETGVDALIAVQASAGGWGAPPLVWPGWPDVLV